MDASSPASLVIADIDHLAELMSRARAMIPPSRGSVYIKSSEVCAVCNAILRAKDKAMACGKYILCTNCFLAGDDSEPMDEAYMQKYPAARAHALRAVLRSFTHAKYSRAITMRTTQTIGTCTTCGNYRHTMCNWWKDTDSGMRLICDACICIVDARVRNITATSPLICEVIREYIMDVRVYLAGIIYEVKLISDETNSLVFS